MIAQMLHSLLGVITYIVILVGGTAIMHAIIGR